MAEIPVEPRPVLPLWAALLGLLALCGTVWILFAIGADGKTAPGVDNAERVAAL